MFAFPSHSEDSRHWFQELKEATPFLTHQTDPEDPPPFPTHEPEPEDPPPPDDPGDPPPPEGP